MFKITKSYIPSKFKTSIILISDIHYTNRKDIKKLDKLYNVLIRLGDFIKNSFLQISSKTIEKRFPVGLTLAFIIIVFLIAFYM